MSSIDDIRCGPADEQKGFGRLPCPRCVDARSIVSLYLDDLETFRCLHCEAEFSIDDIQAIMDRWRPVLAWIESAKTFTEGES
jgi:hypothetical protein